LLKSFWVFRYETSNGISRSEHALIINEGTDKEYIAVRGNIAYVGADGKTYSVTYIADANGFQPIGDHLVH